MKKKLVLIVEDEKGLALEMAELLKESFTYEPLIANNGKEALAILKKHERWLGLGNNKISCILLDFQMPEMSGEEFIREYRKQEMKNPFKQFMPIIITTAYDDLQRWDVATDPMHGMASGYLVKPVDKDKLLNLLHKVIFLKDAETLIEATLKKDHEKHGVKVR